MREAYAPSCQSKFSDSPACKPHRAAR